MPQLHRERGEVAVPGHDAKAVDLASVHALHRIDHERHIGGVFAGGMAEKLDGFDGVALQQILAAPHVGVGPVRVGALYDEFAVAGGAAQQLRGERASRAFGVDEEGEDLLVVQSAGHGGIPRSSEGAAAMP